MRHEVVETILAAGAVLFGGGAVAAAVVVAGTADCGGRSGDSGPRAREPASVAWSDGAGRSSSECMASGGPGPAQEPGAGSACTAAPAAPASPAEDRFLVGLAAVEPTIGSTKDLAPGRLGQWAVCRVTGSTFLVGSDTPAVEVRGNVHVFCCDACSTRFLAEVLRNGGESAGGT